jgi:hypothetical protein
MGAATHCTAWSSPAGASPVRAVTRGCHPRLLGVGRQSIFRRGPDRAAPHRLGVVVAVERGRAGRAVRPAAASHGIRRASFRFQFGLITETSYQVQVNALVGCPGSVQVVKQSPGISAAGHSSDHRERSGVSLQQVPPVGRVVDLPPPLRCRLGLPALSPWRPGHQLGYRGFPAEPLW